MRASAPPTVGYVELLRGNRDFRNLFAARLVSLCGDWFNTLAVLALLRELGGLSAGSFAWVLIFKMAPALFVSPVAGVIADRLPRRRILIATDLLRAAVVAAMFAMVWWPSVGALYGLVLLQAAISTFFEPARSALLPEIVRPEELTAANALGAAAWSSMLTLGAAAGGLVTAYLGWEAALVVDVGTYLLSAVLLLGVREVPPPPRPEGQDGAAGSDLADLLGLRDLREGARYVASRPRVLTLMLVKTGWSLAGALTLVLTVLGEQVYAVDGEPMLGVAALYMARGLGTGSGPIVARWLSRSEPAAMERLILWGFAGGGVFYLLLPGAGGLAAAVLIVALAHLGGATIWVFSTIRLQQIVPSAVRGRVFAAELAAFTTAQGFSTWVYGRLIDESIVPLSGAVALLGVTLLVAAGAWALRGRRYGWARPGAPPAI